MPTTTRTTAATLHFRNLAGAPFRRLYPNGCKLVGVVVEPEAIDMQDYGQPIAGRRHKLMPRYAITSHAGDVFHCKWKGYKPGGTRYEWFDTLEEAKAHARKWCRRRFRIPAQTEGGTS